MHGGAVQHIAMCVHAAAAAAAMPPAVQVLHQRRASTRVTFVHVVSLARLEALLHLCRFDFLIAELLG